MNNSPDASKVNRMSLVSEVLCDFHHKLAEGILQRVSLMHQVQYQPTVTANKLTKGTRGPSKTLVISATTESDVSASIWKDYPRKEIFYETSVIAVGKLLQHSSLEPIIHLVLSWLPPEYSKIIPISIGGTLEDFTFATFAKRTGSGSLARTYDVANVVIHIAVADIVAYLMNFYDGNNLEPALAKTLVNIAIELQKPCDAKFSPHSEFISFMYEKASKQWATILSAAQAFGMGGSPTELLMSIISTKKEDLLFRYFRALRMTRLHLETGLADAISFVNFCAEYIENCRNKTHRTYIIDILDRALHSIIWEAEPSFQVEIQNLLAKVAKWIKIDELEGLSLRLWATCISHAGEDVFEAEYEAFLNRKVLRKNWKAHSHKDHFLEAIATLLEGNYRGTKLRWRPVKSPEYQTPQWTDATSFSFCPLNRNSQKMANRLRALCGSVFQKTILKTPDANSVSACVRIIKQISVHSCKVTQTILVPMLANEKIAVPGDRLAVFRSFYGMLLPWKLFGKFCTDLTQHRALLYRELQLRFNICFEDSIRAVAPDTYSMIGLPFYPQNYFPSIVDLGKLDYSFDVSFSEDPQADFHALKVNESVKRVKFITEESYPALHIAQAMNFARRTITETTTRWFHGSGIPSLEINYEDSSLPSPSPSPLRGEYKDRGHLDLATYIIKCIQVTTTTTFWSNLSENFFGHLILHPDSNLSEATASTLQWLIYEYPEYRAKVISALISCALCYSDATSAGIETLLSHIVFLIGIWSGMNQSSDRSHDRFGAGSPMTDNNLLVAGEALALVHLCHQSSNVRIAALQLIHGLYGLYPTSTKCISSLLFQHEQQIMENARFHFLLHCSYGNFDSVHILSQSPLPTIEMCCMSQNYVLWCFVLAQICKIATQEQLECIGEARSTVFSKRISTGGNNKIEENSVFSDVAVARLNYHVLMFSTSDTSNAAQVTMVSQFHEYLNSGNTYWNNLQTDNDIVLEEMYLVIQCVHPCMLPETICSLQKFYTDLGKKTKPKVHHSFARLISRLSSSDSFSHIIKVNDLSTCESMKKLLDEMATTLESFVSQSQSKAANTSFFIYFAQTVTNVCKAMQKSYLFCQNGPLRVNLFSSVAKGLNWPIQMRQRLFESLLHFDTKSTSESNKSTKGSTIRREETRPTDLRVAVEFKQKLISREADIAYAALLHLGPLFVDQKVSPENLIWATNLDRKYHTLRSLLSFQFKTLISSFVDSSYLHNESNLFIHAILDQFIQPKIEPVPQWQISELYTKHEQALEHRQKLIPRREILTTNKQDQEFTEIILEHVGVFIFLLFMNLVHPATQIRVRTIKVVQRLVPIRFGKEQSRPPSPETLQTAERLSNLPCAVSSQLIEVITQNANLISAITAETCSEFTMQVFHEAFVRVPTLSSDSMKCWALECLLPWCDHINLENMSNQSEFLGKIFKDLTHDLVQSKYKVPKELIVFWQRLACANPVNHPIIVDFLLLKLDHPTCRTLIIYLYQIDTQPSLEHLIHPLTSSGNTSFFQCNTSLRYNLFSRKDSAKKRLLLCNSIMIVLSDFVIDSIAQLLPYLHVGLTWSLLFFNYPQEQQFLAQFLRNVLESLIHMLITNELGDDNTIIELQRIITFLQPEHCRNFIWKHSNVPDLTVLDTSQTLYPLETPETPIRLTTSELIAVLVRAFRLIGADELIEVWMEESLLWATSEIQPSIKIYSLEIFNQLHQTATEQHTKTLLHCFIITAQSLQIDIDQYTTGIIRSNRFDPSSSTLSTSNVPELRQMLLEILSIFECTVVPQLTAKGIFSVALHVFWVVVTLLRNVHSAFASIRTKALSVLYSFTKCEFLSSVSVPLIRSQERELANAAEWKFVGVLPLTIHALYSRDMETVAIDCIMNMLLIAPQNGLVFHLSKSNKIMDSFLVTVACILPWLHSYLSTKSFNKNSLQVSFVLRLLEAIPKIAELKKGISKEFRSSLVDTLEKFVSGNYNASPDSFISAAVEPICRKTKKHSISLISDILSSILHSTRSNMYSSSVALTGFGFVEHSSEQDVIAEFANIFQFACSGLNRQVPSRDKLFSKSIENTQLHNPVPGAAPAPPLKKKQTQIVTRFSADGLNNVLDLKPIRTSGEYRSQLDMTHLKIMRFPSSDNVLRIAQSPPNGSPSSPRCTKESDGSPAHLQARRSLSRQSFLNTHRSTGSVSPK